MAVIDDFQIGVTDTMADPYYDALQAALADGNPNVIGIAGRAFLIDNVNGQWLRTHINVVEQRNVGTNRDLLLLPQGVWRQTVSSWHKGAGQTNMDREDSDIERYYQSWNIDPFDKWQLKPLNQTELVMNIPASEDARTWIQEVRGDMFGAVGSIIFCVSDFETWDRQELTLPGEALDVTSDGEWFYVAHGDGVTAYSNTTGTLTEEATYPAGGSGDVTMVLWSKDRLFTSSGNELYEVTSGTAELVYTQPLADFRWVDGTEAPGCSDVAYC